MTEESEFKLIGTQADYRPPSLKMANEFPHTLCSYCPLSRWYKRTAWNCYCLQYNRIMYDKAGKQIKPVVMCDARELEIIRLKGQ